MLIVLTDRLDGQCLHFFVCKCWNAYVRPYNSRLKRMSLTLMSPRQFVIVVVARNQYNIFYNYRTS